MLKLVVGVLCLSLVSAYFSEEQGLYDDSTPYYDTHPDDGIYIEGDIEVDLGRNAIPSSHSLWPSGVIPYEIDAGYPSTVKTRIIAAMREIEYNVNIDGQYNCVHYKERTNEHNYIHVIAKNSSCSSRIGYSGHGRQDVSIGHGCEHRGIIMHELMHALGFYHEQSRPDRNSYVNIDLSNVGSTHRHNYDIHSTSNTLNTAYDYGSVMHYNAYEFGVDRSHPVMTPKNHVVPAGIKMGQRLHYSHNDVKKIQRLYHCHEDQSHVKTRPANTDDHCDFTNDACALHQETNDDFDFVIHSGHSASGPGADDSSGSGKYALATAAGHHGKKARMTTITHTSHKVCIDWYFFNHGSTGSVKLYFVPEGSYSRTIKSYGHQQSKKWYHVYNTLTVNGNGHYKLMFEANTMDADIAIDDINIYEGDCL